MESESNNILKLQTLKLLEIIDLKEKNEMLFELNIGLLQRLLKKYREIDMSLDIETKTMISEIRLILHKIGSEDIMNSCYQPKGNTNKINREGNSTHKIKSYIVEYFIVR